MNKEQLSTFDKKLLLKDLCARLPYGVKCKIENIENCYTLTNIDINNFENISLSFFIYEHKGRKNEYVAEPIQVKPYLLPMSSMTDEQKEEYCSLQQRVIYNSKGLINSDVMDYVNWCYKNHIDINNLIPMGLAIDCTNLNIY